MFDRLACLSSIRLQLQNEEAEEELEGGGRGEKEASPSSSPSPTTSSSPKSWSSSAGKNGSSNNVWCSNSNCKKKKKNNPYSTLGLSKFSTLLIDLEERRRNLNYAKSERVPINDVRFFYSNSGDWVPVFLKLRDQNPNPNPNRNRNRNRNHHHINRKHQDDTYPQLQLSQINPSPTKARTLPDHRKVHKKNSHKSIQKLERWRRRRIRPSQYLPIVLLLILVCLIMFGKSLTILLTSAFWYFIPTNKTTPAITPISSKPNKDHHHHHHHH